MNKKEEEKKQSADQQKPRESSSQELKDEQLSEVSGGADNVICTICLAPVPCACIP